MILGVPDSVFARARAEDSKPWNDQDGLPRHLMEYKRLHPDAIIDPEMPPESARVQAIKFLKLRHLPGSLLGEWQYPLPSIEVLRPPTMFPPPVRVMSFPVNEENVYSGSNSF